MTTEPVCPNCCNPINDHPRNQCMLAVLIQCLRERGELEEGQLLKLHQDCDVDALWDQLGLVIDDLGNGRYSLGDMPL